MFSLGTVIVLAVIALSIGAAAGAFAFRQFGGKSDLEKRLQESERQFKDYQTDVTEHFAETSRRVNELTRSYKDVHEYLASSAMKLTNPQMSQAISQAAQKNLPTKDGIKPDDNDSAFDAPTYDSDEPMSAKGKRKETETA